MKEKIGKLVIWLVLVPAAILLAPPPTSEFIKEKYSNILINLNLDRFINSDSYSFYFNLRDRIKDKNWKAALKKIDKYGGTFSLSSEPSKELLDTYKQTKDIQIARILYANYAIQINSPKPDFFYKLRPKLDFQSGWQIPRRKQVKFDYPKAMKEGERIDPDNSLYNIFLAYYYLSNGFIYEKEFDQNTKSQVVDKRLFDLGIKEVIKASKKTNFETYEKDFSNLKVSLLPEVRSYEEYLLEESVAVLGLSGDARLREFARNVGSSMKYLASNGRKSEALDLAESVNKINERILSDSNSFIDISVNQAILSVTLKPARDTYRLCGREDLAIIAQSKRAALKAIDKRIRKDFDSGKSKIEDYNDPACLFRNYAKPGELKPAAYMQLILNEKINYYIISLIFLLGLIWTILKAFLWHIRPRQAQLKTEMLLFSVKAYIKIFSIGFLLPTACYYIISRVLMVFKWQNLSAFDYKMFDILAIVFGLCIYLIPVFMAGKELRKICAGKRIELPEVKEERIQKLKTYIIALIYFLSLYAAYKIAIAIKISENAPGALLIGFGLTTIFGLGLWVLITLIKQRSSHKIFFTALSKTLVPIYAITSLLLSIVIWPYLTRSETKLLNEDKVAFIHREQNLGGMNILEHRMVEKYKSKIIEVLEK
jgi:hypothetical protein